MATFRRHFPPLQDVILVLAACSFPVFSWSIYHFLERMTGWLFYLNLWDILSIFAYTQAFALLESLVLVLVLVALAAAMPARLLRGKFVAIGSAVILLSAAWAALAQYSDGILRQMPARSMAVWLAVYLATIGMSAFLIQRHERLEAFVTAVAERLSVLLYVYLPVGLLSILVIAIRNL